jgi:hypothetical protein
VKRWRLETEEGESYFVYAPAESDAVTLLRAAKLGTFTGGICEVGTFENNVLTIPQQEAQAIAASIQYGPVKPAKGRRG